MAKEEKGASFGRREDFEKGTGLVQGELIWHNPRFEMFNYGGKGPSTPAFAVDLEPEEGDNITQMWSVGNAEDWAPSKDGHKIVPIGKAVKLSASSNFFQLIGSILDAGFPEDKSGDDVTAYDGMKCDMIRVSQPERKGLKQAERKYEATILLVDKIISYPWDKDKKGEKAAGKKKEAEAGEEEDDLSVMATEAILGILDDNPKGIQRMKLASEVFKRLKADKFEQTTINRIVQLIGGKDESFLESGGNVVTLTFTGAEPWSYKGGVVSK